MTGAWVGMTGGRAAHARCASNPSDRTQPKIRRSSAVERSSGTDLQTLICQWLLSGAAIFSRPDLHQNSKTTIFRVLRRSKGLLAINNLSVSSQRYNARARAYLCRNSLLGQKVLAQPTHGLPLAHRTAGFVKATVVEARATSLHGLHRLHGHQRILWPHLQSHNQQWCTPGERHTCE